jgi:hypothetical protein
MYQCFDDRFFGILKNGMGKESLLREKNNKNNDDEEKL